MAQVLLIEDDLAIRSALSRALTERGHAMASAATASAGLALIDKDPPDLVLLDLGLPDIDGLQVLRMMRAVSAVPVIVATARDDDRAVVAALDAGADDYVIKPFSAAQLDARVRAVLRRAAVNDGQSAPIDIGEIRIDAPARVVTRNGVEVTLTPKEFDLLLYLADRPGRVVSRRELLTEVWRQPYAGNDKTVDVHLSWLRRKLGESGQHPRYLHTIRGAGVRLDIPDRDPDGPCDDSGPKA